MTRDRIMRDAAGILSARYKIGEWASTNQLINISLSEWLGLTEDPFVKNYGYPSLVMQAVALAKEEISNDLRKQRQEQEMKNRDATAAPVLQALNQKGVGNMDRVFG